MRTGQDARHNHPNPRRSLRPDMQLSSYRKNLVTGLCLLFLEPVSFASEAPSSSLTEDYFLGEMPVVLSASRLAQPISESPAAMTIIDRNMIEASGAINIPDVLRLAPGFQVSHISGQNLTAQYHGIADQHPKRMQVLIDGRSVYHSAFGGVHWDTLPITLDDIERIEVLRGSNAATYGSNAFMGVVNIVTRAAAANHGNGISMLTGANGTRSVEWHFGDRIGQLDYRFSASALETDGFPNYVDHHTYWDSTGGPVAPASVITGTPLQPETTFYKLAREDSQAIGRLNLRGDYLIDNGDMLLFELGYVHNDRDNTRDNGSYDLLRPDENLRASSQLLKWTHQSAFSGELSAQVYHNRLDFDNRNVAVGVDRIEEDPPFSTCSLFPAFSAFPLPPGTKGCLINAGPTLGGYQFTNDRYDLELQHTLPERDGWRTVWGAGMRLDRIESTNFLIDNKDAERLQYRLFANAEKHFGAHDQWVLNAGLMLENQQDLGAFTSPRIAINYHWDELNTVRLAVARAYRMPSFYEQFGETRLFRPSTSPPFYFTGYTSQGQDIEPEELRSLELGWFVAKGKEGISLDARVFYEQLENYIDEVGHEGGCVTCDPYSVAFGKHDIWVSENAGSLDMLGFDLHADMDISDRTHFLASASIVHANGHRIHKRNGWSGPVTDNQPIDDFVPRLTFSALWSHRFDHAVSGSIGLYHMGKMNWPNDGDRLPPYSRIDLRMAKKLHLGGNTASLEFIAQNILDDDYIEFRLDNHFERRLYVRFKLDMD